MTADETVSAKIAAAFPGLSRGQKQIARFVVDNEYFVAFASAAEVAQKVGVSPATVVRFCQALDYEGYPHLQEAIRQRFPRAAATVKKIEERLTGPVPENDVLAQVFATDIDNIKHTMELVAGEAFESAVAEMEGATSILVVGGGIAASAAHFLAHSLKKMGFPVQAVTTGGMPLSLELSALKPEDVLIGISFWRYYRETVDAMSRAKEIGTKRIAITDSELSPLARLADHVFVVATDGVAHSASPTASLALVSAFVAALAFRRPQQTLDALRSVDAGYRESRILVEE
jgi:DNA-binding MurR/RpiR family transcriptional regulator